MWNACIYLFLHMSYPPFLIRRLEARDDKIVAKIFRDVVVEKTMVRSLCARSMPIPARVRLFLVSNNRATPARCSSRCLAR